MEISHFKELFNYNHTVRRNYIDTFKQKLSWEDMIKNRETGWLSLKDTLLHIIWVEDSWINYSIQGLEDPNRPFPYSNYNSWNAIDNYNLNSTLKINNAQCYYQHLRLHLRRIHHNTLGNHLLL
jgi:uncharacterized damage-inducible protein DinB